MDAQTSESKRGWQAPTVDEEGGCSTREDGGDDHYCYDGPE